MKQLGITDELDHCVDLRNGFEAILFCRVTKDKSFAYRPIRLALTTYSTGSTGAVATVWQSVSIPRRTAQRTVEVSELRRHLGRPSPCSLKFYPWPKSDWSDWLDLAGFATGIPFPAAISFDRRRCRAHTEISGEISMTGYGFFLSQQILQVWPRPFGILGMHHANSFLWSILFAVV